MEIYLICENVDLGYHVLEAHTDFDLANERIDTLNSAYELKTRQQLSGHPWNYSEKQLQQHLCSKRYFLQQTELIKRIS